MPTRLETINDALRETGNNEVELDDGTLEWDTASRAYDRELPILLEAHTWNFATTSEKLDKCAPEENPSQRFEFAYEIPDDCLFLVNAYVGGQPIDYEIVDHKVCCDVDSAAVDLIGVFVRCPNNNAASNTFYAILRKQVETACLRTLNEDYNEANRRQAEAVALLTTERTRIDRQAPRRKVFRSRLLARRRGGISSLPER